MRRIRFPHPIVLLVGCVILAAVLTWVIPPGEFDRAPDAATGREVVVPGTYHAVDPAPVGPFAALVAVPRGMVAAAEVIFLVLLVGGGFMVVEATGARAFTAKLLSMASSGSSRSARPFTTPALLTRMSTGRSTRRAAS